MRRNNQLNLVNQAGWLLIGLVCSQPLDGLDLLSVLLQRPGRTLHAFCWSGLAWCFTPWKTPPICYDGCLELNVVVISPNPTDTHFLPVERSQDLDP